MWFPAKFALVAAALTAATLTTPFASAQVESEASPRHHIVEIHNFKFVPATLTIRQGETVEWVNRDIAPHTATEDERDWDTGKLAKGQSTLITFSSAGTTTYQCTFHPNMRGEVIVTQ